MKLNRSTSREKIRTYEEAVQSGFSELYDSEGALAVFSPTESNLGHLSDDSDRMLQHVPDLGRLRLVCGHRTLFL